MNLTTLGAVHLAAALMALLLGLSVFPAAKGTAFHRAMGAGYVVATVVLNVTALSLYRLTGAFNAFHVLALISLVSVANGLWPLVRRTPGWQHRHYRPMIGSYLGLWAATVTEAARLVPAARALVPRESVVTVGVAVALVFLVLAILVNRRLARTYEAA
jgi:uncharacterized membrane protein